MRTVGVAEAKAKLSELLAEAEAGQSVAIKRRGKIVARLVAEPPRKPIDVERLRALTANMTYQEESAGDFIRRMRDEERY
ncbi:type II toxin-antitoxin system prevent-host-death family antitoxin [Devosia sp.]|uniref:type II toxin-antitoxin system Phd/YefM family antitoxin n=1 Tax=Devosia sp. TaxID=1871048 RepID=UPI0035B4CD0C